MALFIQIQDGQPINHPVYDFNLFQAFGQIPEGWQMFERIAAPVPNEYQILASHESTYQQIDGTWKDVWDLRDMTAEEKAAKQQAVKDAFAAREQASNWSAWVFDEATCTMQPPIPRPDPVEGKIVVWCGADANWKEAPTYPTDEGQYKFDFLAWQWVAVVN